MILFGGVVFWVIVVVICITEMSLCYTKQSGWGLTLLVAVAIAGFFGVNEWPSINWKLVAFYPAGCVIWLPCYWLLELRKRRRKCSLKIQEYGTIKAACEAHHYGGASEGYSLSSGKGENSEYTAKVLHPYKSDITFNAVVWVLSVVVFTFENVIDWAIDEVTQWANAVRDKFSAELTAAGQ